MASSSGKTVLVLGAGGNACQILVPKLIEDGYDVRAVDIHRLEYDCTCSQASVTDAAEMLRLARGADVIVHAAGLHNTLPRNPKNPEVYQPFWDVNIEATHTVYRAALYAEVPKVVFFSSQAYYAAGPGVVDESYPASRPARDYYDLSKVLSEEIAQLYAARHGIAGVMLRPGDYTRHPEPRPNFLMGRLRKEDVGQAARLAVDYDPEGGFEAFNVLAGNPFGPDDLPDMAARPMELIDRYWPGAAELMRSKGEDWKGGNRLFTIRRAETRLGYRPQFTFETYLETLGWKRP